MDEERKKKQILNPAIALTKAQAFCAYQERSHQELRDKLYDWGLWPDAVENIISQLISDNFLNEERFALAYAGGKFRNNKWGKVKIKIGLKQHRISEYCIKRGIASIEPVEYLKTIKTVADKQLKTIKEKDPVKRNYKLASYLISRGFESDLVWDCIKNLNDKNFNFAE